MIKKNLSIQKKLAIIFGILIIIAMNIQMFLAVRSTRHTVIKSLETQLEEKAKDTAKIVDGKIEAFIQFLKGLSNVPFLVNTNVSFEKKAEMLANSFHEESSHEKDEHSFHEDIMHIAIADTKGNLYTFGEKTIDVSKQAWFSQTMSGKPFMSEPFISDIDDELIIFIAVPIYKQQQIVGSFVVTLNGLWLSKQIKDMLIGKDGFIYIIGSTGNFIADASVDINDKESFKYIEQKWNTMEEAQKNSQFKGLAEIEKKALQAQALGTGKYSWFGIKRIAGYSNINRYGWGVITAVPVKEFMGSVNALRLWMIAIGFIILLIALVLVFIIARKIGKPIQMVSVIAHTIANFDLSQINMLEKKNYANDELGKLSNAMDDMAKKLKVMIQEIQTSGEHIALGSKELQTTSQMMSNEASEQAATSEEIAASMTEIAGSIQTNSENAHQTQEIAQNSVSMADESATAVNETILSMNQIADKVNIIQEIAGQTRLLSLNASIEAARAGVSGKGFAVVATEVSKLAEMSAEAAGAIEKLSSQSVKVANNAGEKLKILVPRIKETTELVKNIALVSWEQNTSVKQVNTSIQQINNVVQNNVSQAEELTATAESFFDYAQQLQKMVQQFKL